MYNTMLKCTVLKYLQVLLFKKKINSPISQVFQGPLWNQINILETFVYFINKQSKQGCYLKDVKNSFFQKIKM